MYYPYTYPFSPEIMPMWHVVVFCIGACFGSFLNVCIWRIPRDESIVTPPSRCPKCGHMLAWFENFPIFGWLLLRGKCRKCKNPISIRYLLMELLTASMFLAVWLKVVLSHHYLGLVVPFLVITCLIITTFFIDLEHFFIPDETTYPAIALGLVFALIWPEFWTLPKEAVVTRWMALLRCGGMTLAVTLIFWGFAAVGKMIFKKDALGLGDVKYLAAVAACLGGIAVFFTVLFGSLVGSIIGLGLVFSRGKKMKSAIPFGPCLTVGTYIWILFGEQILRGYLAVLNYYHG